MRSVLGLVVLLALLLVGLGVGLSNTTPMSLSFVGFETPRLPFFVWLLLAVALGAVVSGVLAWFRQSALRRENRRLTKQLQKRQN